MKKIPEGATVAEIVYNGKTVKKEQVVPGLVKTGDAFLVQCKITKNWTYCNSERLAKLIARYGSVEKVGTEYVGRIGKRTLKLVISPTPAVVPVVEEVVEEVVAPVTAPVAE